ncbi:MAG: S16 family serine protease [Desulfobacterales bacterium]
MPRDYFENLDIHIHVPAGAIPKDGLPGIAMATALISAITQRPVDTEVAMTGEITCGVGCCPLAACGKISGCASFRY